MQWRKQSVGLSCRAPGSMPRFWRNRALPSSAWAFGTSPMARRNSPGTGQASAGKLSPSFIAKGGSTGTVEGTMPYGRATSHGEHPTQKPLKLLADSERGLRPGAADARGGIEARRADDGFQVGGRSMRGL